MISSMINNKIGEFLLREAEAAQVNFNEVEAGMKLMEVKDETGESIGFKPYYYLKISKQFVRYIDVSELL